MADKPQDRRSFLTRVMTGAAGGWVALTSGSALASLLGGCPGPAKYGGPPPATPRREPPQREPPPAPPRRKQARPRPEPAPPPAATKYGGPSMGRKYGGPPPVTKYGGPPPNP